MNTDFYLYFPEETAAREAGRRLERAGYSVEVDLAPDEDDRWLALATKRVPRGDLDNVEEQMEGLAQALGGDYDGLEYDVDS